MKNKKIFTLLFLLGFVIFDSCTDNFEELNTDTKHPLSADALSLFSNATYNLYDYLNEASVNNNVFRLYAQYWAQTSYPDESQYGQITRNIPDNWFRNNYRDVLLDLKLAKASLAEDLLISEGIKKNMYTQIEFVSIHSWVILVEFFGDIPYFEALDLSIPTPKYDDGKTVYDSLIVRLDTVIKHFDEKFKGFDNDILYNGDISKWKKAANSLKFRMAIRLADSDAAKAKKMIGEIDKSVLILENKDNLKIKYTSAQPYANPVYENLVASGRDDYVPANTLVDIMQTEVEREENQFTSGTEKVKVVDTVIFDPRVHAYFNTDSLKNYDTVWYNIADKKDIRKGSKFFFKENIKYIKAGKYGSSNTYSALTPMSKLIKEPTLSGIVFNAAEGNFLIAEAIERGFMAGNAEQYYNKGIEASCEEWGVDCKKHLLRENVDYSNPKSGSTWKEKISRQKWLALFNNGIEGWNVWRMNGFPKFNKPNTGTTNDPKEDIDFPYRLVYPTNEQTLNPENVPKGVKKTDKLFFMK